MRTSYSKQINNVIQSLHILDHAYEINGFEQLKFMNLEKKQ